MNVLGLDLSTKPGFALITDKKLMFYGTLDNTELFKKAKKSYNYPESYLKATDQIVYNIYELIESLIPNYGIIDVVVIEETTGSHNNYSQKILEFIHYSLCKLLLENQFKIVYIRDGVWKKMMGAHMTKDEKNNNAKISRLKRELGVKIVRKDKKGNKLRKVSKKDAYIRAANSMFNLSLKRKDEDQAAAILLARCYFDNPPLCDGNITGGLIKGKL